MAFDQNSCYENMKKAKWIGPNFTSDSFDKAQSILSIQYQQEI